MHQDSAYKEQLQVLEMACTQSLAAGQPAAVLLATCKEGL